MRTLMIVVMSLFLCCDGDDPADAGSGDDSRLELGPPDCPTNSGWPCTCTHRSSPCYDGTFCAIISQGQGICAAECIEGAPPGSICPATSFPAHGRCMLQESPSSPPTRCILTCAHSDACPSDQECRNISASTGVGQCLP